MPGETFPTNGAVIRALRRAYGLKLHELATRTGLSVGYLSNVELGHKDASPAVLRRLAEVLSVPVAALITTAASEFVATTQ